MAVETIAIAGRELPFRRSLGALNEFDSKYKNEGLTVLNLDFTKMRVEHMAFLLFCVIKGGYKFEGKECDITLEWIYDNAEVSDLETFAKSFSDDEGDEKKT